MATFSQGFLANLGRPAMTESLFGLGTAIGGLPGQYKGMKQREADKAALSKLTPYSAEYYNEVARQLIRDGKKTEAIRFQELARQVQDKQALISASRKAIAGGPTEKREAASEFAGIGKLAEAMTAEKAAETEGANRGKTALARYMKNLSDKKEDLNSLNVQKGFDGIARAYGVSFEDASEIFQEALGQDEQNKINNGLADAIKEKYPNVARAARLGDPEAKKFAYKVLTNNLEDGDEDDIEFKFGTATDRARDKDGNMYLLSTVKNSQTGEVTVAHSPVGDAPPYDPARQGPLQYISRVGETASETRIAETEQEDRKKWLEQRGEMLLDFTNAPQIVAKAERAIEALENINTSGFDAAIKQVTDFTGTTSADAGVFNSSVSDFILESLGKLGANPTEGERKFLIEASASLKTSKEVNRALLNRVKNTYSDIIERGRWLVKNPQASRDEYANWMLSPQEETVITFDADGNRVTNN